MQNQQVNMNWSRIDSGMNIVDLVTIVGPTRGLVQSSSDKNKFYSVDLRTQECNCPDFNYRHVKCKHLRAVEAKIGVYS